LADVKEPQLISLIRRVAAIWL